MQGQRRGRRLGTPPGPPALAVGNEDTRAEAEISRGIWCGSRRGSYGREAHAAAQGGEPPQVRASCQHSSRVGESPRKLPGNGSQPKPIGAKAQSAKTPIFVGAVCGELLQVVAQNALITQRSLVHRARLPRRKRPRPGWRKRTSGSDGLRRRRPRAESGSTPHASELRRLLDEATRAEAQLAREERRATAAVNAAQKALRAAQGASATAKQRRCA
jgi:hypothetical protein